MCRITYIIQLHSLAEHEVNQAKDHLDPVGEGGPLLERVLHAVVRRVVAEAHRRDRRSDEVERFKVAEQNGLLHKFEPLDTHQILDRHDNDPATGKVVDKEHELEASEEPFEQVIKHVAIQYEDVAQFIE